MSRAIYSLYIDIPEDELDFFDKDILKEGQNPRISIPKTNSKNTIIILLKTNKEYADVIGAEFYLDVSIMISLGIM